jgi:hypothetical protein
LRLSIFAGANLLAFNEASNGCGNLVRYGTIARKIGRSRLDYISVWLVSNVWLIDNSSSYKVSF